MTLALQIENLVKSYRAPDGTVLRIVDVPTFRVEVGQQLALAGASGSGKTTFLNLIAGILKADAGVIRIDGHDMASLGESARDRLRAQSLGYVFQTFNLLQGYTALENVVLGMAFGPGPNTRRAADLLNQVGLGTRLTYRPRQLSVGQQQRVALARALANRPKLVLADEPTGNLDARSAADAIHLLRKTCRDENAALLVVSHDNTVLAQFETVVLFAEVNRAFQPPVATPEVRA